MKHPMRWISLSVLFLVLVSCSSGAGLRKNTSEDWGWFVLDSEGSGLELDLEAPVFQRFVEDEEILKRLPSLTPEGLEALSEKFFVRFPALKGELVAYGFATGLGQNLVPMRPYLFRPTSVSFELRGEGHVVARLEARDQEGVGYFGVTRLSGTEEKVLGHMEHSFQFSAMAGVHGCRASEAIYSGFENHNVRLGDGWCSTLNLADGEYLHSTEYVLLKGEFGKSAETAKLTESDVAGHCARWVKFAEGKLVESYPVFCRDRVQMGYDRASRDIRADFNKQVFQVMSLAGAPSGYVSASLPAAVFRVESKSRVVINRYEGPRRTRCLAGEGDLGDPSRWRCSLGAALGSW